MKGDGKTVIVENLADSFEIRKGETIQGRRIEGDLDPFCRKHYDDLLIQHHGDWQKVMDHVIVRRVILSEKDRQGIGTFQPKDEKNQDSIDMVMLDMIMPDMGGGEVYDRLKSLNPKIRVLLSSGYSIDGQATEILNRGCDGFIQKPYNLTQLAEKIKETLNP